MISFSLSNRIVFVFSLLGLLVAGFLFYEYSLNGPILCPTGKGCDVVRASPFSSFLGISIPLLGIAYYFTMAILSVIHSHQISHLLIRRLQVWAAGASVAFGVYLTYLEGFVIKAYCFWCVSSFIISIVILLALVASKKETKGENRD